MKKLPLSLDVQKIYNNLPLQFPDCCKFINSSKRFLSGLVNFSSCQLLQAMFQHALGFLFAFFVCLPVLAFWLQCFGCVLFSWPACFGVVMSCFELVYGLFCCSFSPLANFWSFHCAFWPWRWPLLYLPPFLVIYGIALCL